jgi:putative SOS response-associated peptidase YedK
LAFQQNTGSKNAKGVHHSEAKTRTAFIIMKQKRERHTLFWSKTPTAFTILKQNANGVHHSEAKTRTVFTIRKQKRERHSYSEAERQRRSLIPAQGCFNPGNKHGSRF